MTRRSSWPDGTPAPPLEGKTYTQIARPGARAPHVWLADGRSTLDLYGRGFVLLRLGAECAGGRGHAAARRPRPACRCEVDRARRSRTCSRPTSARLVLVRPDGHVAWRDDAEPRDAARRHRLRARARGRCRRQARVGP